MNFLENYVPQKTNSIIESLEELGGVVVGKGNMCECGMGSISETSFGIVSSPFELGVSAGGSCSGNINQK